MRHLVFSLACLLATCALRAEQELEPVTLTSKEIEQGWILLFDRETTFGWKIDGDVAVVDSVLVLGGRRETTATTSTELGSATLYLVADVDKAPDAQMTLNSDAFLLIKAAPP